MERKIGEIFEYNGEWYQCLKAIRTCSGCAFRGIQCSKIKSIRGECQKSRRNNGDVIFKKLKKVGEPYVYKGRWMQPYERATNALICDWNDNYLLLEHGDSNVIDIELKKTEEDKEEKNNGNTPLNVLTDKYVNGDICYDDFEKEVKALYSCKEEIKPTLKEFDLEAAKAGKPVCTRDGRKARIICFDSTLENYPLVVLVGDYPYSYTAEGKFNKDSESSSDLMMLSEKKDGWAVIRKRDIYETEEQAKEEILKYRVGAMVRKIEWEE